MTKIHYDETLLINTVKSNLATGINNLNNTNTICMSISIPSGFSQASVIDDFKNTVATELSNLNKIDSMLNSSEKLYNGVSNTVTEEINGLDSYKIILREDGIKG